MKTTAKYFVADLVEEVGSLPTVAAQIVAQSSDPNCDMGDLCRLIQSDSVMTMRFLALANSAALSGAHETRNLRGALVRLGLRRVRNVSLFMGMHDLHPLDRPSPNLDMKEFWKYSLATASCAQGLAWQRGSKAFEDAWLAGILHGIGIVALDQTAERGFQEALNLACEREIRLTEAEMLTLEFHHGELGARILKQWGLPRIFAEIIDYHAEDFEPEEVQEEAGSLIGILQEAIEVVRAFSFGDCGDGRKPLDLEDLGGFLKLAPPAVEALAAKVDREVRDLSRLIGLNLEGDHFQKALEDSKHQAARLGLEGFEDTLAKEKLEEQLTMARDIQQHLLPQSLPQAPGFELAAINRSCLQVSGDYYDFLPFNDGLVGIVIADVCGKGMPASLLASNLQASIRALSLAFSDPGELLAAVNNALFTSTNPEHFATLFLAVLDPATGTFRYASAGHNPPLLLRQDGQVEWLKPAGTPVGMFNGMKYPVMEVQLNQGDLVVTYTDGITEAVDPQGEEFQESGLEKAVRDCSSRPCPRIIDQVISRVLCHVAETDFPAEGTDTDNPLDLYSGIDAGDDLTMVLFRRTD
jgi:serine phosphatase RsbU (regulator of sigma subunit)/HD-like signal output (HDOD) protein